MNSLERDPRNFTRAEWEPAKRAKQDPKALKAMFQECWAIPDSPKAFANALQARGYTLAQGDRRSHVAVDFRGEIYAVAKWIGVRTKEMRSKLGDAERLPTISEAKATIAASMTSMLRGHIARAEADSQKQLAALAFRKSELVEKQRKERADLEAAHEKRWAKGKRRTRRTTEQRLSRDLGPTDRPVRQTGSGKRTGSPRSLTPRPPRKGRADRTPH